MFYGVYTALITPFNLDLSIDYKSLQILLDKQIHAKVDGLVVLGTTSESPTITDKEKIELISFIMKYVKGRTRIIIGIASNNTMHCCDEIQKYQKYESSGDLHGKFDGFLLVNPFYNKPTQEGLYLHFKQVALSCNKPILLYNVLSRCGVTLSIDTIIRLAEIPNIVGIKECSDNMNYIMQLIKHKPKNFNILCGEDALFYNYLSVGAVGCISVATNIIADKFLHIYHNIMQKNYDLALDIHLKHLDFINALFYESNPIPIKTLLAYLGNIENTFRLPLCKMTQEKSNELIKIYKEIYHG